MRGAENQDKAKDIIGLWMQNRNGVTITKVTSVNVVNKITVNQKNYVVLQ